MKMKLSKKLMLFEEFTEIKTEVGSTVDTDVDYGMKGEIIQDVDTIISKLEDLANNLGSDRVGTTETANESNEILVEGAADQLMSAELYMLPLVAAGLVGGAAVGVGVLIKRAMKRKKIKKLFSKEIEKPRLEAMNLKIQKAEEKEADKKKKMEAEIKKLEAGASTMQTSLGEKYPNSKDLLAALNADLNFKITSILIKKGVLTPSELEKAKQLNTNSQETIETANANAAQEKEKGKEIAKNATDEEKEEIRKAAEEAKEKMSPEQKAKNSKEGESKDDESKEPTQEELDAADKGVSDAKASYDEVKDGDDEKAKLQAEIKVKQAQQKRAKLKDNDELYQGLGDDIGELMKKIQALG